MKLSVSAKVIVTFPITFHELVMLRSLSHRHYDYHCRTVGEVGGFLYGWWNTFWPHVGPNTRTEDVDVNSYELDTLFKLLEMELNATDKAVMASLLKRLREVRSVIEKYSKEWRVEVVE